MNNFQNRKKISVKADNSVLFVHPTEQQIKQVYDFCQNFHQYASDFMFLTIDLPKKISYSGIQIIESEENLNMVLTILKEQKFFYIQTVSQSIDSYKGFISWIMIATQSRVYLIDSISLHRKCFDLKQILEDKKITKFMKNYHKVIDQLKRDFSIFSANVFDIDLLYNYYCEKSKLNLRQNNLSQYVRNNVNQPSTRPISKMLLINIQQFYQTSFKCFFLIDQFFQQNDVQYRSYAFFNNYEVILKPYCHQIISQAQNYQILKIKKYHQQNKLKHQNKNAFKNKKIHQQKCKPSIQIVQQLLSWREHYAKIKDLNVQKILPFIVIDELVKNNVKSVLQISEICSDFQMMQTIQVYEQILQVFHIDQQEKQNKLNQTNINSKKISFIKKQQKSILHLLRDIGWCSIDEWLNKKNDQSLKLYKEIISINEFDNSIVQQEIQKMEQKSLKKHQILKFVKFAQHFRNKNHRRLKQTYDSSRKYIQQEDHEWFRNQQDQQGQNKNYCGWDAIQNQINSKTMDTIKNSNSSINLFCSQESLPIKSQNKLDFGSDIFLKQKCINSLKHLQSPVLKKIQPLPESIQTIYMLAANLKKNNGKQQKKKKQNKSKALIEQDFIPSKEDIFNLIYC